MNCIAKFLTLVLGFILIGVTSSQASPPTMGGVGDGGGQGVLCTASDGTSTLEPLDIYEAKYVWAYRIPNSPSLPEELRRVWINLQLFWDFNNIPTYPSSPTDKEVTDFTNGIADFFAKMQSIPKGARLTLSSDTGPLYIQPPASCHLVQVLRYVDDDWENGKLLVDRELWNLLSPQGQLAFYLHEKIYKELRANGDQTSQRTRKLIGLIFSSQQFPGRFISVYNQPKIQFCSASSPTNPNLDIGFYVIPFSGPQGHAKIVIKDLATETPSDPLVLVDTTVFSLWSFEDFQSSILNTSPFMNFTNSVLGSQVLSFDVSDRHCINSGKPCEINVFIKDKNNQWQGGPLTCRNGY